MMKKMKKFLAVILTAAMTFALAAPAFAIEGDTNNAETGSITINNATKEERTFEGIPDDEVDSYTGQKYKLVDGEYVEAEDDYTGRFYKLVGTPDSNLPYIAYQVFSASPYVNEDGTYTGDDQTTDTNTWGHMVSDDDNIVSYTATQAQVEAITALWAEGEEIFEFTASPALDDNGDPIYLVKLVEGKTAQNVANFFNSNLGTLAGENSPFTSYEMTYNENEGTATVSGIPYGYYFVTSALGTVCSVDTTNKDVVIADKNNYEDNGGFIPSDGNGLKNITEVAGKEIEPGTEVSAAIGETVTYVIGVKTTNYVLVDAEGNIVKKNGDGVQQKKVEYVFVNDQLDKGLTYVPNDEGEFPDSVTINGEELTKVEKTEDGPTYQTPEEGFIYYIEKTEAQEAGDNTEEVKESFKITIPWLDENGNRVFADNSVLKVTYKAMLNEYVEVGEGQDPNANTDNNADITVQYTEPDTPPGPPEEGRQTKVEEDTKSIYTYALAIMKVDADDTSKVLEGAEFKIYKVSEDEEEEEPQTELRATRGASDEDEADGVLLGGVPAKDDNGEVIPGRYNFDARYIDGSLEKPDDYTETFTTNEKGEIFLYGVAAGDYYAIEYQAPKGYNLLVGRAEFSAVVAKETVTTTTVTTHLYFVKDPEGEYMRDPEDQEKFIPYTEEAGDVERFRLESEESEGAEVETLEYEEHDFASVAIAVLDKKGVELPSTGGMGTTLFYVIGSILVIGAGLVLVARKRMTIG